ncbi:3-deoxy-manno-octulosonate cytidylyltransferase [Aestuariibacter salexigens]|uniref:3-deoxy-manno-octulosonate cytidylyltransferase n=1 Tax=Aestuariibacter salexigens TaxID=226010 RepID=UPI00047DA3B5|nr:3-deoxy-manno-octulosonate cytidylyltransferase [Aestuariibacter salexigens]
MKVVVGIPARLGSTRFPGKPLCNIHGKTMLEHVYRRCSLSRYADQTFIAACDPEIQEHAEAIGAHVVMTAPDISRPGLRVAVAAEQLGLDDNDIVVVVQGDEPLVNPEMIDMAIQPLLEHPDVFVSNLIAPLTEEEWQDPGEIKVVCDLQMNAIYMSRSPIPSIAHEEQRTDWWKQVCIMPFRWHFMKKFNHELTATPLELQESIEMLRAIQHGFKVRMVPSPFISKSVDTDADREQVETLMENDDIFQRFGF